MKKPYMAIGDTWGKIPHALNQIVNKMNSNELTLEEGLKELSSKYHVRLETYHRLNDKGVECYAHFFNIGHGIGLLWNTDIEVNKRVKKQA